MKKYILTHDTFIDDLRDAAEVAAKHNRQSLADNLTRHADELRNFDIHTGWTDPFPDDNIFRWTAETPRAAGSAGRSRPSHSPRSTTASSSPTAPSPTS